MSDSPSSSRPIQAGDLVCVVRGHKCVVELAGGIPFKVSGIDTIEGEDYHCSRCGQEHIAASREYVDGICGIRRIPLSWLLRIDPPASGEYTGVPVRLSVPVKTVLT